MITAAQIGLGLNGEAGGGETGRVAALGIFRRHVKINLISLSQAKTKLRRGKLHLANCLDFIPFHLDTLARQIVSRGFS